MPRKKSFIEDDTTKDESKLIEMLKNDEKLREEPDYRMAMISQATMFLEDFGNNIYLTSIEMHEKIPFFSIDAWKDFPKLPNSTQIHQEFQG